MCFVWCLGESVTTDGLVYAVFEFTGCLVQQQSFHPMLLPHLSDIIFFSLYYMQMTTDDVSTLCSSMATVQVLSGST